jgi:hypothetical protein
MRSFGDIPLSFERAFGMITISPTHIETDPKTPLMPFVQNVLEDQIILEGWATSSPSWSSANAL